MLPRECWSCLFVTQDIIVDVLASPCPPSFVLVMRDVTMQRLDQMTALG